MTSSWFINFEQVARPEMRLICFSYAGGSAAVFRSFADGLPRGFEVWAANLPGHGSRLREAPLVDLKPLAEILVQALEPLLLHSPFAFFGYSLGARLAFEVARSLRRRGQALPGHLFVAACAAPQLPPTGRAWHTFEDNDLVAEIRQYNGLPEELLGEPEMLDLLLPALRADLKMYETAIYEPQRPFAFPCTAFGGNQDPLVNVKEVEAWQDQTTGRFQMLLLDGDHFFLREAQSSVLDRIANAELSIIDN